jgi:hypothetical protein
MEHFEKLALDSAQHKPSLWLRYVDDTCGLASWSRAVKEFLSSQFKAFCPFHYGNRVSVIPFLDVLVIGKGQHWPPKFTENPPTLSDISASNLTICCI